MLDLKNLIIDTKSVWMEFPGYEGFEVEIANLSRQAMNKIRKNCTITKFDRSTRVAHETLDEKKFVDEFTKAVVKNWKGLTLDHAQSLILLDTKGKNLKEEVKYSHENAKALVSGSVEFDTWLNEVVYDLDNFRDSGEGASKEKAN